MAIITKVKQIDKGSFSTAFIFENEEHKEILGLSPIDNSTNIKDWLKSMSLSQRAMEVAGSSQDFVKIPKPYGIICNRIRTPVALMEFVKGRKFQLGTLTEKEFNKTAKLVALFLSKLHDKKNLAPFRKHFFFSETNPYNNDKYNYSQLYAAEMDILDIYDKVSLEADANCSKGKVLGHADLRLDNMMIEKGSGKLVVFDFGHSGPMKKYEEFCSMFYPSKMKSKFVEKVIDEYSSITGAKISFPHIATLECFREVLEGSKNPFFIKKNVDFELEATIEGMKEIGLNNEVPKLLSKTKAYRKSYGLS